MVYNPLRNGTLNRPLLISILTDRGLLKGDTDLVKVIVKCRNELHKKGRPKAGVKFLISQIGSLDEAVKFLRSLKDARENNSALANVLHIFAGRFNDEFNLYYNKRKLDQWLIETLFKPLATSKSI